MGGNASLAVTLGVDPEREHVRLRTGDVGCTGACGEINSFSRLVFFFNIRSVETILSECCIDVAGET